MWSERIKHDELSESIADALVKKNFGPNIKLVLIDRENSSLSNCAFSFSQKSVDSVKLLKLHKIHDQSKRISVYSSHIAPYWTTFISIFFEILTRPKNLTPPKNLSII